MAGAICGALGGAGAIPTSWAEGVGGDVDATQREMAGRLVEIARAKARTEIAAWQPLASGH
jgi:hypothetical protein